MNNNMFDSLPYLQQMSEQFRKMFGDDFVKNLMNSMQMPNWSQMPGAGVPPSASDTVRAQAQPGEPQNHADSRVGSNGWSPFTPANEQASASIQFPLGDIYETRHEVVLVLDVPGVEKSSDIRLSVFPDALIVKGTVERNYGQSLDALKISERYNGNFERRFILPARVRKQHAKATYRSGVLEIRLVKELKPVEGDGNLIDVDFL